MKEYIIRFVPTEDFNPSAGYFDNLVVNDIATSEDYAKACKILKEISFRVEEVQK